MTLLARVLERVRQRPKHEQVSILLVESDAEDLARAQARLDALRARAELWRLLPVEPNHHEP